MAVPNANQLLEQADRLAAPPPAGAPRQVDLRRAISTAYYGLFHYILAAAADEFVGTSKRSTKLYALVYRSVDHRALRELCNELRKPQLSAKYRKYEPSKGFGPNIPIFASALLDLYEKRHAADYDPSSRMKTADARVVIATARSAIRRFEKASPVRRKTFLTLLLFPPRVS